MTIAVGVVVAAFLAQNAPKKAPATATTRAAKAASDKPIRVLFIGNSLTYRNDLPAQIQALVGASYPRGRPLRYESVTPPGRTLKQQWDEGKAAPKIAQGGWDYVVLQEQSQIPFTDRNPMYQYARLFDQEIKKVGARTVLYMTFPLKNKFDDGDLLPEIYLTLGKELRAIVVPVDLAWHEAARRDRQIALYAPDNAHPAPAGTYLAACCFALTLWARRHARSLRRCSEQTRGANRSSASSSGRPTHCKWRPRWSRRSPPMPGPRPPPISLRKEKRRPARQRPARPARFGWICSTARTPPAGSTPIRSGRSKAGR